MNCLLKAGLLTLLTLMSGVGEGIRLEAAVTASSLAVVGYDDFQDSFTLVALSGLSTGESIYFTNNGWSSIQGKFNGADATQGAGNESLIKLTVTQQVPEGTVIFSGTNSAAWQWTKTGEIPGQIGGSALFSDLSLDYESDQIYAFQGLDANPLLNPSHFIYVLHFGSMDYPFFSDSEDTLTGDVPPGLSLSAKNAFAHSNLVLHGDADGLHSAWGLNVSAPAIAALQSSGGSQAQWLAAIANSSNWGPGQPSVNTFFVAPEPSKALLLGGSLFVVFARRQKYGRYLNVWKL